MSQTRSPFGNQPSAKPAVSKDLRIISSLLAIQAVIWFTIGAIVGKYAL
jgi:hypothetical protein